MSTAIVNGESVTYLDRVRVAVVSDPDGNVIVDVDTGTDRYGDRGVTVWVDRKLIATGGE